MKNDAAIDQESKHALKVAVVTVITLWAGILVV